jgi:hypothetical protein
MEEQEFTSEERCPKCGAEVKHQITIAPMFRVVARCVSAKCNWGLTVEVSTRWIAERLVQRSGI